MNDLRRFLGSVFLLLMAGSSQGCGGGGTAPPEPETPHAAAVTISPSSTVLRALGATVQFTATVRDQRGREMPGHTVTWNSSDPGVASIGGDGMATALADGSATIVAVATPSVSGWAGLSVEAVPLDITTGSTPVGVVGQEYLLVLEGEGISIPAWEVVAGGLPPGLALEPSSGTISGTPTEVGGHTFTVQLSSGGQTVQREMTITIISGTLGIGFGEDQFSLVPAGTFQMGQADGDADESPVHTVTITSPFLLQKTEVTQGQWRSVMGTDPSAFGSCGDTCPVERVSWEDIQAFLLALSALDPDASYRLPTEAEWEYAARAGTTGWYGGTGAVDEMGWHSGNSGRKTHFVGLKTPNAWGLYDMHGNVYEWVQDWYSSDYYGVSPDEDPPGPLGGTRRVLRGGSVDQDPVHARSANRFNSVPSSVGFTIYYGLRLVRMPS